MTFRQALVQFDTDYHNICVVNGITEREIDEKERLLYLSKAYAELSFNERLIEKKTTIDLTAGVYEYTPSFAFASIQQVRFNDGGSNMAILDKVSYENMPQSQRPTGIPTKWTIYGLNTTRVLIIDTLPDQSYSSSNNYRLTVYYSEKIMLYSGAADGSFTGLDFASSTGGGSFICPSEWDDLIVMKAICRVLPVDIKQTYLLENEQAEIKLKQNKPLVIEPNLPYYL